MAQRQFKIEIQHPCRQNTAELTRSGDGFFCAHCDKVILNFADMSDEQLIHFLSRKHEKEICGVFSPRQMEGVCLPETQRSRIAPTKLGLLLAGLLSLRFSVSAQQPTAVASRPQASQQTAHRPAPVRALLFKGKVSDRHAKQPLPATLRIYADRFGEKLIDSLVCDSSGAYQIALPVGGLQRFFVVIYSCEDCLERSVVIDRERFPAFLPVTLLRFPTMEVTVPEIVIVTQPVTYTSDGYSYAGISPLVSEVYTPPAYKRFFRRIGFFFKKTFRLKRH